MFDLFAAPRSVGVRCAAVSRFHENHYAGDVTGSEFLRQLFGIRRMVTVARPAHGSTLRAVAFQCLSQTCDRVWPGGCADQQPVSRVGVRRLRQLSLLPLDGQQSLVHHPACSVVLGSSGAAHQPLNSEQNLPVPVEQVEVCFDPGNVDSGHPRVAVVSIAHGTVGLQAPQTQWQPQHLIAQGMDFGTCGNRLETRIEESGVHAVSGLFRADFAGQGQFDEDGAGGLLADMQDAKAAERRTALISALGHAFADDIATFGMRMRREQCRHVVSRGEPILGRLQHGGGVSQLFAVLIGLDQEFDDTW